MAPSITCGTATACAWRKPLFGSFSATVGVLSTSSVCGALSPAGVTTVNFASLSAKSAGSVTAASSCVSPTLAASCMLGTAALPLPVIFTVACTSPKRSSVAVSRRWPRMTSLVSAPGTTPSGAQTRVRGWSFFSGGFCCAGASASGRDRTAATRNAARRMRRSSPGFREESFRHHPDAEAGQDHHEGGEGEEDEARRAQRPQRDNEEHQPPDQGADEHALHLHGLAADRRQRLLHDDLTRGLARRRRRGEEGAGYLFAAAVTPAGRQVARPQSGVAIGTGQSGHETCLPMTERRSGRREDILYVNS